MKNQIARGEVMNLPAPTGGTVAGTPYLIGVILGIAAMTVLVGVVTPFHLVGAYELMPKTTGEAWTAGDLLYWDNTAKKFTTTATSNKKAGVAYADAASGDATGSVNLGIFTI